MTRPVIYNYSDIVLFMRDMLGYRRANEGDFSVTQVCRSLRRCSPSLISNILAGKRKLTVDRTSDVAVVLGLSLRERSYLKDWMEGGDSKKRREQPLTPSTEHSSVRRRVSSFLLSDWLHPYVKDAIRLASVERSRDEIYRELGAIASHKQIDQSLKFLQHHGYIRLNQDGKLVEADPVHVVGDEDADQKIRKFHKHALEIAKHGLEAFNIEERLAQALLIPLNKKSYSQLLDLIGEFSEKLRAFSEQNTQANERLYQIILHVTPTGGSTFNKHP